MEKYFQDYLAALHNLHADIGQVFDDLPQDALDWKPAEEIPTIAVLVTHLCGAERYWIGDVASSESSDRDREAEFRTKGISGKELKNRLQESYHYANHSLEKFSVEDLDALRISPRDGKSFSVGWSLLHALEHTALHLGHLQILRQLWDQAHG